MHSLTRILRYAVGTKINGNRRVYIQNHEDLNSINFHPHARFSIKETAKEMILSLNENGERKVYASKRGDSIVEVSDKKITDFIGRCARYVTVILRANEIRITRHHLEMQIEARETKFYKSIKKKVITTGSLYSGVMHLSHSMHQGLKMAGFRPRIKFANEMDEVAAKLNAANPIWKSAARNALLVVDDIQTMDMSLLPSYVDHLEVALPCNGQSRMTAPDKRDILHPVTGKLFIRSTEAIAKLNPATLTIECTPSLLGSITFHCLEDFLLKNGYEYEVTTLKGSDYGDFEHRNRFCLFAVSKGLKGLFPSLKDIELFRHPNPQTFAEIKDDIPLTSPLWKEYKHVKQRDNMKNVNYRNVLISDDDRNMPAIVAGYSAPKAGSPFVPHPTNPKLQRQLTVNEHNKIRKFPEDLANEILKLSKGLLAGQSRTNVKAAHKVSGNSVSPGPWKTLMFHMFSGLHNNVKEQLALF
jgi:DNA (cytosine-5)-methyltransferase 1